MSNKIVDAVKLHNQLDAANTNTDGEEFKDGDVLTGIDSISNKSVNFTSDGIKAFIKKHSEAPAPVVDTGNTGGGDTGSAGTGGGTTITQIKPAGPTDVELEGYSLVVDHDFGTNIKINNDTANKVDSLINPDDTNNSWQSRRGTETIIANAGLTPKGDPYTTIGLLADGSKWQGVGASLSFLQKRRVIDLTVDVKRFNKVTYVDYADGLTVAAGDYIYDRLGKRTGSNNEANGAMYKAGTAGVTAGADMSKDTSGIVFNKYKDSALELHFFDTVTAKTVFSFKIEDISVYPWVTKSGTFNITPGLLWRNVEEIGTDWIRVHVRLDTDKMGFSTFETAELHLLTNTQQKNETVSIGPVTIRYPENEQLLKNYTTRYRYGRPVLSTLEARYIEHGVALNTEWQRFQDNDNHRLYNDRLDLAAHIDTRKAPTPSPGAYEDPSQPATSYYDNTARPFSDGDITSGMLKSLRSFDPSKSWFFESKIKCPNGPGVWSAYWLVQDGRWPPEIDILEMPISDKSRTSRFPDTTEYYTYYSVHGPAQPGVAAKYPYNDTATTPKATRANPASQEFTLVTPYEADNVTLGSNGPSWQSPGDNGGRAIHQVDMTLAPHVWGLKWEARQGNNPALCTFYLDGVPMRSVEYDWLNRDGVLANNMQIILNLAIGGSWPKPPAANIFDSGDQIMSVYYNRVWQIGN
jgi:hypothetical protein